MYLGFHKYKACKKMTEQGRPEGAAVEGKCPRAPNLEEAQRAPNDHKKNRKIFFKNLSLIIFMS